MPPQSSPIASSAGADAVTLSADFISTWRTGTLDVSDIAGARPKRLPPPRTSKLPEVDGSQPRRWHDPRKTSDSLRILSQEERLERGGIAVAGANMKLRLDVSDIPGAAPSAIGPFVRDHSSKQPKPWQRPHVMPGEKEREQLEKQAVEEMRQQISLGPGRRPTNDISDIDKTHRIPSQVERSKTRNTQFSTEDIECSKPRPLPKPRSGANDKQSTAYHVKDITDEGRSFQSKRVSNPLEPSYVISPSFCANPNFSTEKENSALEKSLSPQSFSNAYRTIFGEQQKAYSIGPVPKKFATDHISQKLQTGTPLKKAWYALQTRDIPGAYPEYKGEVKNAKLATVQKVEDKGEDFDRKRLEESMHAGSRRSDTFSKGVKKQRDTNPLQPSYNWPAYLEEAQEKQARRRMAEEEDISALISQPVKVNTGDMAETECGESLVAGRRPQSAPIAKQLMDASSQVSSAGIEIVKEQEGARRLAEHLQQRMRTSGVSLLEAFRSLGGGKESSPVPTSSVKDAALAGPEQRIPTTLLARERARRRMVGGKPEISEESASRGQAEAIAPATVQRFLKQNYSVYVPENVISRMVSSVSSNRDGKLRMADIARLLDRSWAPSKEQQRSWIRSAKEVAPRREAGSKTAVGSRKNSGSNGFASLDSRRRSSSASSSGRKSSTQEMERRKAVEEVKNLPNF